MAKSSNGTAAWIKLGIWIIIVVAAIVASTVWTQADVQAVDVKVDATDKDVTELKEDGCDPAQEHTTEIAVIKEQFKTYRKEQQQGFETVIEAINKK